MTTDELLQKPYWIIDILPKQVPENSPGRYFAVEKYYLEKERFAAVKRRHIDLILKLYCYRALAIDGEEEADPSPEHIANEMTIRTLCIRSGDSLILSEPDALHMTLFHPDGELLDLIRELAAGEGLFVWQPPARHDAASGEK